MFIGQGPSRLLIEPSGRLEIAEINPGYPQPAKQPPGLLFGASVVAAEEDNPAPSTWLDRYELFRRQSI